MNLDVVIDGVRYVPAPEPCEDPTLLDFVHNFMDVGRVTIREYLCALLTKLWEEGESFKGKAPYGNSGWEYELYYALVAADAVAGEKEVEEDGTIVVHSCLDIAVANGIIFGLITEMCRPKL
jgi:hypothetical protein